MEQCHYCDRNEPIYKYGSHSEPICVKCATRAGLNVPRQSEKSQNRNETCSCESGKKYKKCCELK